MCWYMYLCDRKNLSWFVARYDFHQIGCVFSISLPRHEDRKHTNRWMEIISSHKPFGNPMIFTPSVKIQVTDQCPGINESTCILLAERIEIFNSVDKM
jgi:hypothetical protein